MSNCETLFSKVHNDDKTRLFRIKTEWEENYFRLFVIDGTTSWFALITKEHIDTLAEQHEITADAYLKNLKEYIANNQSSVTFDLVDKKFFIYRKIEKQKFRMKYFFVKLEKLVYQETMETFMDELVAKYTDLSKKLGLLEQQKLEANSQKLLFEKKCEQFAEVKRKADLHMYSAFTLALNEKKHRIRFLTEQLEEYKTGNKTKINTTVETNKKNPDKRKLTKSAIKETKSVCAPKEELSDSDSNHSDGYNTDEEKSSRISKNVDAIPGTSRENLDFLGGDSPPRSLPKRFKREQKNSCSISSTIIDKNKNKPLDKSTEKVNDDTINNKQESSDEEPQSVRFDTQDLLDRM